MKALMKDAKKKSFALFNRISNSYDRANRFLSFGFDLFWRKQVAAYLPNKSAISLLDCATGTAEQLLYLLKSSPQIHSATGVDMAENMLLLARDKCREHLATKRVTLLYGDCHNLNLPSQSFDCATISFGIRNMHTPLSCLQEMHRLLTPSGRALILEFSLPHIPLFRQLYLFYLRYLLPLWGAVITGDRQAYNYLAQTIEEFPSGDRFCSLLLEAGFCKAAAYPLTGGIVTLYVGEKNG